MYNATATGCPENFDYVRLTDRLSENPDDHVCYAIFPMNLRRESASMYCRAMDPRAHLVVVNSEREQELLAGGVGIVSCK